MNSEFPMQIDFIKGTSCFDKIIFYFLYWEMLTVMSMRKKIFVLLLVSDASFSQYLWRLSKIVGQLLRRWLDVLIISFQFQAEPFLWVFLFRIMCLQKKIKTNSSDGRHLMGKNSQQLHGRMHFIWWIKVLQEETGFSKARSISLSH